MIRTLVPLASGVEEIEAVVMLDVFRRAGFRVTAAGLAAGPVIASRGVRLLPDTDWDSCNPLDHDMLVLPGGAEGAKTLAADRRVIDAIRQFVKAGKILGAICAAPLVLQAAGVLDGRRATCHPSMRSQLTAAILVNDRVVVDGRIVTSQGPGTAFEFALTLVRLAASSAQADAVAAGLIL
jgi:4-methyl-5(b-hydroxyethyl)-thiazole monophosphate biosynthesis